MRPVLTGGSSRANLHTRGPRYHRPGVHPSVAPGHAHRHVANHEGRRVMSMPKRGAVTTAMLLATLSPRSAYFTKRMIDWSAGFPWGGGTGNDARPAENFSAGAKEVTSTRTRSIGWFEEAYVRRRG